MLSNINLDQLKILQKAGGILNGEPTSWDAFRECPEDLIKAWYCFVESRKKFNEILDKYGVEGVS